MANDLSGVILARRVRALSCGLLVFLAGDSHANIDSIQIQPLAPTERDTIAVLVDGRLSDSCWFLDGSSTTEPPDTLLFSIFASDSVATFSRCLQSLRPYSVSGHYGPLPAGHYVLRVTEYHDSPRQPLPDLQVREFDVAPFTPIRSSRWGYIKALFR